MFIVSWLFDKLGYMPKISIESTWPFPAVQQRLYTAWIWTTCKTS